MWLSMILCFLIWNQPFYSQGAPETWFWRVTFLTSHHWVCCCSPQGFASASVNVTVNELGGAFPLTFLIDLSTQARWLGPVLFAAEFVSKWSSVSLLGILVEPAGEASCAGVRVGVVLVGRLGTASLFPQGPSPTQVPYSILIGWIFREICQTWNKVVHKTVFCVT